MRSLHFFIIPILLLCWLLIGVGEMGGEHAVCARAAQRSINMQDLCK